MPGKGKKSSAKKVTPSVKTYVQRAIKRNETPRAYYNAQSAVTVAYDNPHIADLTVISQGDDAHNRAGNKIRPRYIEVRAEVDIATGNLPKVCRIMLIQWRKDSNLSTPGINIAGTNTVLAGSGGTGSEFLAPFFLEFEPYFTVLWDKTVVLDGTDNGHYVKILIPRKKLANITYNEDASTAGKQHVYLLATSNKSNSSGYAPTIQYVYRVQFDTN